MSASENDHEAIIKAFQYRDEQQARAAMAEHMRNAGELLAKNFAGNGDDGPLTTDS